MIDKHKMGKHFHTTITDTTLHRTRPHRRRSQLDGITCCAPASTPTPRSPRSSRATRTSQHRTRLPHRQDRRPGPATHHHRLDERVKRADLHARLLPSLAPAQSLGATDIHRRTPAPTGQPGRARATLRRRRRKAARKHDPVGNPLRSFRGLLDHLATLTRNQIRYHHTNSEVPMLADPTPDQRRAFDLLNTPIPLTAAA